MYTTNPPERRGRALGAWLCIAVAVACGAGDSGSDANPEARRPPAKNQAPLPDIDVAANDPKTRAPFDATPSPEGDAVYYTALGEVAGESTPGVFAVAADGGEIRTLAMGEPLTAPVNISVSFDGELLFVADPAASVVFALPSAGGTPRALEGTEGYAPRGLVVAKLGEREYLYFTGRDPRSQEAGVFRVGTRGGAVESIATGEPFTDPAGVIVDRRGVAYVVETGAGGPSASVIRVRDGEARSFVSGIGVGFPAGITLTRDERMLLVSGLDPETRRDVVYFVDTDSRAISRLTETVGKFEEPAGLHRAHNADVFAWADAQANETGTVYVLRP